MIKRLARWILRNEPKPPRQEMARYCIVTRAEFAWHQRMLCASHLAHLVHTKASTPLNDMGYVTLVDPKTQTTYVWSDDPMNLVVLGLKAQEEAS